MRIYLSILFGALVAPVFAQAPTDPNESMIWDAYRNLQTESNFEIDINGTEADFGVTKRFSSSLYFETATNPTTGGATSARIELDDYDTSGKTPVLVHRYVGDGSTLWSYNLNTQTYSSKFYSFYGTKPPADYPGSDTPRMIGQLYAAVHGPTSFMVRMMREIFPEGSSNPRYHSWAPEYAPGQATLTPGTQDPITGQTYIGTTANAWILYGPFGSYLPGTATSSARPNSRSVGFNIVDKSANQSGSDLQLTQAYVVERTSNHYLDLNLVVTDPIGTLPSGAFVPYSAAALRFWQPLSSPRGYSGTSFERS